VDPFQIELSGRREQRSERDEPDLRRGSAKVIDPVELRWRLDAHQKR
jgi:hypothetical protein